MLASACLPLLHHAIEIDGEAYWDGGYAANPPLIPLVRASEGDHALVVQVTPMTSERLPRTAREIAKRIEQIQFNATLNSELEALKYGKMIGATEKLRRLRIGRISARRSSRASPTKAQAISTGTFSNACRPAAGSLRNCGCSRICRKLRLPAGPTRPLLSSKQIAPTKTPRGFLTSIKVQSYLQRLGRAGSNCPGEIFK